MKRKSRRAKCQKVSPFSGDLQLIERDAAAVDVGSRSHWVAVNPQRDPNPVREFGAFTADLISLADWLAQCEAKSVVMEATGVYWVSLYELLERRVLRFTGSMPTRCVICPAAPKVTLKTVNGFVDCTVMGCCEAHFGRRRRSANCATTYARARSSLKLRLNSSFACRML